MPLASALGRAAVRALAFGSGLALLAGGPAARAAADAPVASLRCRGEESDPRVADWRARAVDDGLLRFAAGCFGPPVACEGRLGKEIEGRAFGRIRFAFAGGAALEIETAPPETSRVALTVPQGFADEAAARAALEDYARSVGTRIDWSKPASDSEAGDGRVVSFWDPSAGLNAGAELRYRGGRLVGLALHMAL